MDYQDKKNTIESEPVSRKMPSRRPARAIDRARLAQEAVQTETKTVAEAGTDEVIFSEKTEESSVTVPEEAAAEQINDVPKETAVEQINEIPEEVDAEQTNEGPEEVENEASEESVNETTEVISEEITEEPEKETTETTKKPLPEKKKPKQKSKKPSFFRKHLGAVIAVAVAVLIIVILVILFANGKENVRLKEDFMGQIRTQEVIECDIPAINDFFLAYYTALAAGNTSVLESMYDEPEKAPITAEISTIVNKFDNFKVYVTPGIKDNDIIAFVYNDVHFANIDTAAPSVDSFYLRYNPEDASLKIVADAENNTDILKYMNLISYREPIRSLLAETNEKLNNQLAANQNLNSLYVLMQSMTQNADTFSDSHTDGK